MENKEKTHLTTFLVEEIGNDLFLRNETKVSFNQITDYVLWLFAY